MWRSLWKVSVFEAVIRGLLLYIPMWISVAMNSSHISDPVGFAVLVFWTTIPMLNAFWDSISWYATWHLLTHLQAALVRKQTNHQPATLRRWRRTIGTAQKFGIVCLHVAANLIISASIFLITLFAVILALVMMNAIIAPRHLEYQIDVPKLLHSVNADPYHGDGLWVTMMIAVTLVPAFVHLFIVFFSMFALAFESHRVRAAWSILSRNPKKLLDRDSAHARKLVSLYVAVSMLFFSSFVVLAAAAERSYGSSRSFGHIVEAVGNMAVVVACRLVGHAVFPCS